MEVLARRSEEVSANVAVVVGGDVEKRRAVEVEGTWLPCLREQVRQADHPPACPPDLRSTPISVPMRASTDRSECPLESRLVPPLLKHRRALPFAPLLRRTPTSVSSPLPTRRSRLARRPLLPLLLLRPERPAAHPLLPTNNLVNNRGRPTMRRQVGRRRPWQMRKVLQRTDTDPRRTAECNTTTRSNILTTRKRPQREPTALTTLRQLIRPRAAAATQAATRRMLLPGTPAQPTEAAHRRSRTPEAVTSTRGSCLVRRRRLSVNPRNSLLRADKVRRAGTPTRQRTARLLLREADPVRTVGGSAAALY